MSWSATSSSDPTPAAPPRDVSTEDAGPDAFGQTGIRQYIGKALAWSCIISAILTSALWYRSTFFQDDAHWQQKNQEIDVHSVHSRLIISFSTTAGHPDSVSGWGYRGGYTHHVEDGWKNSFWKWVGVELSFHPLDPAATSGVWLRVKWQFIVACLLAIPLIRGIYLLVRRWREAQG